MPTAIPTPAQENKKSGCFYMRGQAALLERSADTSALYAVVPAPETAYDQEVQERLAGWLGGIALEQTIHVESLDLPEQTSLAQLITEAKLGNEQAMAAVRMNAHTTVIETLLKTGNVTRIEAEVAPNGSLRQHGHTYDSIHRNTMRSTTNKSPGVQRRAKTEALNWQRTEAAIANGELEHNWFVAFSLPPEHMPIADMKKEGFFVHTMTGVVQATTLHEGKVVTESGFVAGMSEVKEDVDATNEHNNQQIAVASQKRYDIAIIRDMYEQWGVTGASDMSTEDLLATPLLVPKNLMPHGVSSLVELYDSYLGQDYFFGLQQPRQAYETFADTCAKKAAQYNSITDRVIQDLLDEAESFQGKPDLAIARLYEYAQFHSLERAYRDKSIDASVFGAKGEYRTKRARMYYDSNDVEAFMREANLGHQEAVTTACGGGAGTSGEGASGEGGQASAEGAAAGGGAGAAGMNVEKGSDAIKWRNGYCRLDTSVCPEKGKRTLVGQCEVCIKCQTIYFDKGVDPTKFYTRKAKKPQQSDVALAA